MVGDEYGELGQPERGQAALEGVKTRGKSHAGEKTMIDALEPGLAAYSAAIANGQDVTAALQAAATAAEDGMRATIPMLATKGRASYLGERSAGHLDPGAVSSAYILRAAVTAAGAGRGASGGDA